MDDEFDDQDLETVLRRHAEQLTGPVDTDGALADVQRRARTRRRRRTATTTLAAAAAAAIAVVIAAGALLDDRGTVRSPAAPPDVTPTSAATETTQTTPTTPAPVTTPPIVTTLPPITTAPVTSAPAEPAPPASTPLPASTTEPAPVSPTTPPAAQGPDQTAPPASTSTYSSAGGSIVVRLAGGAIALASDPSPSAGWSVRIDDNGPTRVRVRFERDGQRSEIRVDLEGDQLVPEIIEQ